MSFYTDSSEEENYNGIDSEKYFDISLFDKDSINGDKSILVSKDNSKIINDDINKDSYKENDILSNYSFNNIENSNGIDNIFQQNLSNSFPIFPNFPPYVNPMVTIIFKIYKIFKLII